MTSPVRLSPGGRGRRGSGAGPVGSTSHSVSDGPGPVEERGPCKYQTLNSHRAHIQSIYIIPACQKHVITYMYASMSGQIIK